MRAEDLKLEPCTECPVPMNVTIKPLAVKEGECESFGISCSGGIAERTERLIISLAAIGFDGLGVPYVLATGMWSLAILGLFTVVQRMLIVKRAI